jgi:hypothetical protein
VTDAALTWHAGAAGRLDPDAERGTGALDALLDALRSRPAPTSVTVVGAESALTFDALEQISVAATAGGHAIGVVPTGATPADAAPALGPERGADRWVVYDALRRERCGSHGPDDAIADIFTDPWALVAFIGHGDGSHLNLGAAVLCGLSGAAEVADSVRSDCGCAWEPPTCKKQATVPAVQQAGRLRAHTLALFSCTSMSLARQVYPSNVSIALAAYRAGVRAVIGSTRQVRFTAAFVAEAFELMGRLPTLGAVVTELNARRRVPEDGALVLLGEPAERPPAAAALAAHAAVAARWPAAPRRIGPSFAYPTVPHSAVDGDPALACAVRLLGESAARLTALEQLVRALRWLSGARAGDDGDPVAVALDRIEAARAGCLEQVSRQRFELLSGGAPSADRARPHDRRRDELDAALLALLRTRILDESHPGGGVGDLVAPALALFLDRDEPVPTTERCGHCGGVVLRVALRDPVAPAAGRSRMTCAACGVLSDTALPRFRLARRGRPHPGAGIVFVVDATGLDPARPARGLFQVRDKTRPRAFPMREIEVRAGAEIPLALPGDAGPDIWSARLVAVRDGAIEYARCVFAVTPGAAGAAGAAGVEQEKSR